MEQQNRIIALAKQSSDLISSISTYPGTKFPSPKVVEELVSVIALTSSLLIALNSSISRYTDCWGEVFPLVTPLCTENGTAFEVLNKKIDQVEETSRASNAGILGVKSPRMDSEALGGGEEVESLKMRLLEWRRKCVALIDEVKLLCLHPIVEVNQTAELKDVMDRLELMLPRLVCDLIDVQKTFATNEVPNERLIAVEDLELDNNQDGLGDAKGHLEELQKLPTICSEDTLASAASSMTVIEDSIEEAWILRRSTPRKTLKTSTSFFGIRVMSSYTHENAHSYHVKPIQTCPADIQDIRKRAFGKSTEHQHQADLKKMVLGLNEKAQREIQRLLDCRHSASCNENVRRLWEVVAFKEQPRRKIFAPAQRKWWMIGKKPLLEWIIVLRGVTIDHQKRTTPVKRADPWKAKESAKISLAEKVSDKVQLNMQATKECVTIDEALEKNSNGLAVSVPSTDSDIIKEN